MQASSQTDWVVALNAAGTADVARVGAKAATLGVLVRAGLAVPEGLVLTSAVSEQVRESWQPAADEHHAAALPAPVEAALDRVAEHFGAATLVVRSSAADEDSTAASFAGQYQTVLHVRGPEALRAAVRRVWASADSDQVRAYRRSRGPGHGPGIAVLVQRQVDADVAGVAFTADPVSGSRAAVLVSAVPGLGDAVVSGAQVPDEWRVAGETATAVRVTQQALAEAQARAVAAMALHVEEILGGPQDVEWAMADGRLVVLQARPITALPQPPAAAVPPGTWIKEVERHPESLTVLGASVASPDVTRGLTAMSASYGGLIERFEARMIGGEPYMQVQPIGGHGGPPPPWWLLAVLARLAPPLRRRMRLAARMLRPGVLEGLHAQWESAWRPDLAQTLGRLRAVDLAGLDDAALGAHLDDVLATLHHALDLHFHLIPPYLVPVHDLVAACGELLDWSESEALALLAGASPATSGPSRDLAELAVRIRANQAALAAVERPGADIAAQLSTADAGLGAAFEQWCDRYAYRNVHDDPGSPTLIEMPWLLAGLLREAVRDPAGGQEQARASRLAARRSDGAACARAQLAGRTQADRERFEVALAAALHAYPLREDSAFWTGSMPGGMLRLTAMEIGHRLAARDVLDRADDVVHLPVDVLHAAIAEPGPDDGELRAAVARARAERSWVIAHPGPPFHGPPPEPFPDLRGLPAAGRRLNEALIWMQRSEPVVAVPTQDGRATVAGVAAAPGRYTGPVRVISRATDFGRLQPGEVLVCPTTDPAWTVLFGIAGALITDGGGVLSHAAIVAREYAIPAVVGTGGATRTLRDGQIVTVDGSTGQVTM